MTHPAPKNLNDGQVTPESNPNERKHLLDRYEGGLIVALLALVVGTQFADQLIPSERSEKLEVVRGNESGGLGPVNLLAPIDPKPLPVRNLNTVSRGDLMAISGIGPAMAEAILNHREKKGSFESLDDLLQVPGIGPKRLEQFSMYLSVPKSEPLNDGADDTKTATNSEAINLISRSPQMADQNKGLVNLNKANRGQLMGIPGIGVTFADRILKHREDLGGFRNWSDLDAVSGVGPKRLENLKAHATIDGL